MSQSNNIAKWGSGQTVVDSGISIASIGGSGGMTLLGSYNSSTDGTISDFTQTWSTNYVNLFITTKNTTGTGSTGGAYFILQTSSDSGSTWGNEVNIFQPLSGTATLDYSVIYIYNVGISGIQKNIIITANPSYTDNINNTRYYSSDTTGVVNAIRIKYVSNAYSINGGIIRLYGCK